MTRPTPRVDQYDLAAQWFRQRMPKMTDERFRKLTERAAKEALPVAKDAQLRVVESVWKSLEKAVTKGTTVEDFKKSMVRKLSREWGGMGAEANTSQLELVFQMSTQRAYTYGRVTHYKDPDVAEAFPYWRYDSVLDGRTTSICKTCNGTVMKSNSAWWATHTPPLHFRCRSTIRALTPKQAERYGIDKRGPRVKPDGDFGRLDAYEPDLSETPSPLKAAFKKKP